MGGVHRAHPVGSVVEGEIRNITEFGLFIGLSDDIDGMVHMSDISWDEPGELAMAKFEKGQIVRAKVLDVDVEKERISLGIKQLADDPAADTLSRVHKGEVVTCVVTAIQANGIEVKVDEVLTGFIRRAELARDKRTSARTASPSARRWTPRSPRSTAPPASCRSPSRGGRSRRTSRRWPSSARPIAAPRWATSWVRRSVAATSRRE